MKKNVLIFVLVVALGAIGVWVLFAVGVLPFTEDSNGYSVTVETEDETPTYTFNPLPSNSGVSTPNLNHSVQFSESIPEDVRVIIQTKIENLQTLLAEDETNAGAWYDLAVYYHNANDYIAAKEVWEFLVEVVPESTIAYDNLAKLHHFSLPDFPKSESYFKQSLAINPKVVDPYLGLFDLYRYSYKTETTAAAGILNQAIAQFPEKLDLVLTLGVYYRDQGNYTQARTVLEEGLNKARDANDVNLIAAFGQELERIPQ